MTRRFSSRSVTNIGSSSTSPAEPTFLTISRRGAFSFETFAEGGARVPFELPLAGR